MSLFISGAQTKGCDALDISQPAYALALQTHEKGTFFVRNSKAFLWLPPFMCLSYAK